MNKKIEWLKEHKKEILIGTGMAIGSTVLIVMGWKGCKKVCKSYKESKELEEKIYNSFANVSKEIASYTLDDKAVPIKDLGKVGEDFIANVPGANENTLVQVIAYIENEDLV